MIDPRSEQAYSFINGKANSNQLVQGLSGLAGFPWTLFVDVGVLFTHYGPMLNEVRKVYGRSPMPSEKLTPIVKACSSDLLADLVLDKLAGQIPILGIGFNVMCAKYLTWRLGILFAVLAANGDEVSEHTVSKASQLIQKTFPRKNIFYFEKPEPNKVYHLFSTLDEGSTLELDHKLDELLQGL